MELRKHGTPSRIDRGRRIIRYIRAETRSDNIVLAAAGVAFYAVLAVLPALVIAVSLYGLFTNLDEAERQ
ncbi:MAG: YihY/virulence factor BrkB family protein, partial [Acidimicrobiia bacterium]|nr:YihY/virulence factor BrkB family protein [Acidimicrobiia bacterium]